MQDNESQAKMLVQPAQRMTLGHKHLHDEEWMVHPTKLHLARV